MTLSFLHDLLHKLADPEVRQDVLAREDVQTTRWYQSSDGSPKAFDELLSRGLATERPTRSAPKLTLTLSQPDAPSAAVILTALVETAIERRTKSTDDSTASLRELFTRDFKELDVEVERLIQAVDAAAPEDLPGLTRQLEDAREKQARAATSLKTLDEIANRKPLAEYVVSAPIPSG